MNRLLAVSFTLALAAAATTARAEEVPLPLEQMPDVTVAQADATATPAETPAAAPAATPAPTAAPASMVAAGATKIKVGGVLWTAYSYDMSQGAGGKYLGNKNGFDVTRAYINIEPSWGDDLSARVTTDIVRDALTTGTAGSASTTGSLVDRLKYGYLAWKPMPKMDYQLKFGLQQTPWIDFEETMWGFRVLDNTMLEKYFGIASSDFGLGGVGSELNKMIDFQWLVENGESFKAGEANKFKEAGARVTVRILKAGDQPGLRVSGYYTYGIKNSPDAARIRAIGMVSYQADMFNVAAEYLYANDGQGAGKNAVEGNGESIFGTAKLPMSSFVTLRYDMVTPNNGTQKTTGLSRGIFGVGHKFNDKVLCAVDYQQTSPAASGAKPTQGAFVHAEAKF